MKTIAKCLIPILGLIWMSVYFGCRTLSTSQDQDNPALKSAINGMLYYLPIGKITIKGEFKDIEKKEGATPCQSCTPCAKPIPKPTPQEEMEQSLAPESQAKRGGRQDEGKKEDKEPGSGEISVSQLTVTLSAEEEADEGCGVFYATPLANYWYEDEVKLKVNSKHLLSTGNVTTEDKTVEIVGTLASIAAHVVKAVPSRTPTPPPKISRQPFYFSFHPSNAGEVNDVQGELEARGIVFKVEPTPTSNGKAVTFSSGEIKGLGDRGLVFRPAMSYKVTLIFNAKADPKTTDTGHLIKSTQQFIMPDLSKLYVMEYPRMAFVKKVKNIGFTDGMLTEFNQKVPSPILGFLGIPKAVVQAIVPIPGAPPPSGSALASGTTGSH